jgi:hypothetical protein
MFFGRIGKSGRLFGGALAAALSVSCVQAFAEDQDMTVLAHATSGPLRCEIRKNEAAGSAALTGVIASSQAIAGNFRFVVTKSGPAGSSNINQADKFALADSGESIVGQAKINLESGARIVVALLMTSNDGLQCQTKALLEH